MIRRLNKKGQNTLEYVVILSAIVAAAAAFVTTSLVHQDGVGIGKLFKKAQTKIESSKALEDLDQ